MSKDPAFLFYSADFLVGVSDLTMTERGQYITLMCIQHAKGRLSLKNIEIAIGTVSEDVLAKFKQDENGLYYNERLEQEVLKRKAYSESRSNNIKKRWENANANDTYVLHMNEQSDTCVVHMENKNINDNENNNDIDNNLYFQELFDKLWSRYPKKVKKQVALGSFMKIRPSNDLFDRMMTSLEQHRRWKGWSDPKYIPYASTWLNQKRWEDELPESEMISYDAGDWWEEIERRSHEFDDAINHAIKVVNK